MCVIRPFLSSLFFAVLIWTGYGSPDFFQDLPRSILFVSSLPAIYVLMLRQGGVKKGKERGESDSFFLFLIASTVAAGFFIPFFSGKGITGLHLPPFLRYAGVALFLAGLFLRWIAIRALKQQFSIFVAIQENHQLVTTGIYSRIRHPIYLGAVMSLLGFVLVFPTLLGFIFMLIYSMLLGHRMTQEEKLMLKHFGSVYEEYTMKSYRLIPHIY